MTIAVTGPFASGKSTLVRMLGELGAETVSADEAVHELLANDSETIARVVGRFGEEMRGERGVNRKALGRKVFGNPKALHDLEGILHPLVHRETDRRIRESEADIFVAEIPLLFEGERAGDFDLTVAVAVPEEQRSAWIEERGVEEGSLRAIEARQLPGEEKARRADLVVQNDGDLDKLKREAERIRDEARRKRGSDGAPHGDEES